MRHLTLGALIVLCLAPVVQAQTADAKLMAPIQQFLESFNKGDVAGAAATHAAGAQLFIADEFTPFRWRGPGGARHVAVHTSCVENSFWLSVADPRCCPDNGNKIAPTPAQTHPNPHAREPTPTTTHVHTNIMISCFGMGKITRQPCSQFAVCQQIVVRKRERKDNTSAPLKTAFTMFYPLRK